MSYVRSHQHKCPTCQDKWWCTDAACGRTGFRYDRYCHLGTCNRTVEEAHKKSLTKAERLRLEKLEQLKLFEED